MIVDGAIVLDPGTNAFIGYSHMCNGFEIPEPGVTFYDLKDVPHGNVLIKNYFAKTTNVVAAHLRVHAAGLRTSTTTRYPVLYLQHGGGEDERVWIEMGRTNVILDNLLAEKQDPSPSSWSWKPVPWAAPWQHRPRAERPAAPRPRRSRSAPGAGGAAAAARARRAGSRNRRSWRADAYGQFMVKELIPWIDANFRTLTDRGPPGHGRSVDGRHADRAPSPWTTSTSSRTSACSAAAAADRRPIRMPLHGFRRRRRPNRSTSRPATTGQMANPAEFNKRVHGLFFSGGTHSSRESRRLEEAPAAAHRRGHHEQLRVHLPRHGARMADVAQELVQLRAAALPGLTRLCQIACSRSGKWAVSLPGEFRRRPPCRSRENADACKVGRRGCSSQGGDTAPLAAPDLTR